MTGVKEVSMTQAPEKPKRRSFQSAVKELGNRLMRKQAELEIKAADLAKVTAEHAALEAEVFALTDAYNLVKPQPRTRAKKEAK